MLDSLPAYLYGEPVSFWEILNILPLIYRAKTGHPTEFLKVIHYTLFGASQKVTKYLFANGVDPETQYLPDVKFMTRVFAILVSIFNYKPQLSIE